jgi:predicted metal-dependent HD superfamily phosphohydrolase
MENSLDYVKEKWKKLTAFSKKDELKHQLWEEVVYRYAGQHRHYHNLNNVAHIFTWFDKFIDKVINPAVMGFAILYHNVVYDTYSIDNEEQSAAFAEMHLTQLNVNTVLIEQVKTFIKATKDYTIPECFALAHDLALFLDFNMAILGADEEMYTLYSKKIRQEYSKYTDVVYNEGRKLALQKMLDAKSIFFTEELRQEAEQKARENINREVDLL